MPNNTRKEGQLLVAAELGGIKTKGEVCPLDTQIRLHYPPKFARL